MNEPERRRLALVLLASGLLLVVAAAVAVLLTRGGGPGENEARDVVEDYFDARVADGCGHLSYHSEEFAREYGQTLEECLEAEDLAEGEYFEFVVVKVRVDGEDAQADVENHGDADGVAYTVDLVVEDEEWRVDGIESHDRWG